MATREQRRQARIERITDYRCSGLSMSAWCTANQIKREQLKYWLRKSKEDVSYDSPTPSTHWVPLTVPNQSDTHVPASSLVVRIGQARIELHSGFNPELLREVVHALEKSSC